MYSLYSPVSWSITPVIWCPLVCRLGVHWHEHNGHPCSCKRPVFFNPPTLLICQIFRKRIMAD